MTTLESLGNLVHFSRINLEVKGLKWAQQGIKRKLFFKAVAKMK